MQQWHIFVNVSLRNIFQRGVARKFKIAQIMQAKKSADWLVCAKWPNNPQVRSNSKTNHRGALLHVCAIFHAHRRAFARWYSATVTAQINSAVSSRERRAISPHQKRKAKTNSHEIRDFRRRRGKLKTATSENGAAKWNCRSAHLEKGCFCGIIKRADPTHTRRVLYSNIISESSPFPSECVCM